jgi:hypothetical protein
MTLQQTIKIPADRRVHLDWTLPETWSGDSVRFVIFPVEEERAEAATLALAPTAPTVRALPPKPKDAPEGCNFWQDRMRPGDAPFAWHKYIGAFTGPSVAEFLEDRHAENEREEAKFDAMFHRKQEQPE